MTRNRDLFEKIAPARPAVSVWNDTGNPDRLARIRRHLERLFAHCPCHVTATLPAPLRGTILDYGLAQAVTGEVGSTRSRAEVRERVATAVRQFIPESAEVRVSEPVLGPNGELTLSIRFLADDNNGGRGSQPEELVFNASCQRSHQWVVQDEDWVAGGW